MLSRYRDTDDHGEHGGPGSGLRRRTLALLTASLAVAAGTIALTTSAAGATELIRARQCRRQAGR